MRRLTPVTIVIAVFAAFAVLTASAAAWTTPPTQLSDDTHQADSGGLVDVALSPNGTSISTWVDTSGDIWSSVRPAGDASAWGTPQNITNGSDLVTNRTYDRATAINDSGVAATAWVKGDNDADAVLEVSVRSAGGTWTTQTIATEADIRSPKVAVSPSGVVTVAWYVNNNVGTSAYVAERPAGGPWGAPIAIGNASADSNLSVNNMQFAANANGDAVMEWTEVDHTTWDRKVYVLKHAAGGGAWSAADAHLISANGQSGYGAAASLGISAAGDVAATYEDRVTEAVMAVTKPASGSWTSAVEVASSSSSDQAVAVGPDGTIVVTYIEDSSGATLLNTNFGDMTNTWSGASTVATVSADGHLYDGPFPVVDTAGVATLIWDWTPDRLAGTPVVYASVVSVGDRGATIYDQHDITPTDDTWYVAGFAGNGSGDLAAGLIQYDAGADVSTAFASIGRADGSPVTPPVPSAATLSVSKAKVVKKKASFSTTVTVSGAGKVVQRATFTMKVKGKKKTIVACTLTRTTTKAGAVKLSCKLSAKARKALKRGKLKLTVTTTFTPTGGTAIVKKQTVVIKKAKAKKKR